MSKTYLLHMETSGLDSNRHGITYLGLHDIYTGELIEEVHIDASTYAEIDMDSFTYSDFTIEDMKKGIDIIEGLPPIMNTIRYNTIIGFNMVWMNGFLRKLDVTYASKDTLSIMEYFKWGKLRGIYPSVSLDNLVPNTNQTKRLNKVQKQLWLVKAIMEEPIHGA